jgi:hypothetical protein
VLSATLREIDSALRWERVLNFWERHMRLILGALIVIALSGIALFYRHTQTMHSVEEASGHYTEALQLFRREKNTEAENILHTLAISGPAPYNTLAQFRLAGALAAKDPSAAATMFEGLAKNPDLDPTLRDAARMRSIFLRFETADDLQVFEKELGSLLSPANLWHSNAQELAGLLAWRIGNVDAAKMYFETIHSDPQAPASLQKRAGEFLELVTFSPQTQKAVPTSSQTEKTSGHTPPSSKLKKAP